MTFHTFNQIAKKHQPLLEGHKEAMIKAQEEKGVVFYSMLMNLEEELSQISSIIQARLAIYSKHPSLIAQLGELEEVLGHLIESLEDILEGAYTTLVMKRVYEVLEDDLASIDDIIEELNECDEFEEEPCIPYIEAWDVGFFFE